MTRLLQLQDLFEGAGFINLTPLWESGIPPANYLLGSGGAYLIDVDTRTHAVQVTDFDHGQTTPGARFGVEVLFRANLNTHEVGVTLLGSPSLDDAQDISERVTCIWESAQFVGLGADRFRIFGGGLNLGVLDTQALSPDPFSAHRLRVEATTQGQNGALWGYVFDVYLNGRHVWKSPQAFTVARPHFGLVGRRGAGTNPADILDGLVFFEWWQTFIEGEDQPLEPAPTLPEEVARTPLAAAGETPETSPELFPFKVSVELVRSERSTRSFLSDMGYSVTHPERTVPRRSFTCFWQGTESDANDLLAFHRDRLGGVSNFRAEIRSSGVGTVDVVFAEDGIELTHRARDYYEARFTLVEVF